MRRATLVATFVVAAIGIAFSGAAVGDILDPGAPDPGEGPSLTDWDPQLVNSSTVDTYQVQIAANNSTAGITLIRQRPQVTSTVTQRISMNGSFGNATNPEIVAFEGDDGPQERITKDVFIDGGDVVVELADEAQGAQQQAQLTAITVEFQVESAPNPGLYNFSVDMQGQETTGGQTSDFTTLNETGVAQVEVVDATPASPGDLTLTGLDAPANASQDETQLAVTGTIDNPTASNLSADVVYGLSEGADPAFDGTDLLTQQQNVTVAANSNTTATFFVGLTAEDEAINTSDDIRHGIEVVDSNQTAPLGITAGPVFHSADGGATVNRTTGLIQTAVDISSDSTEDGVLVTLAGSPYGENVTVDVDNIAIVGEEAGGDRPAVAWPGPQPPDGAVNPPFTVTATTENTVITALQVEPLIPDAGGIDVLGGTNHNVLDNHITGTNTGAPGIGIEVRDTTDANVSSNEIANKSNGILFNNVSGAVVSDNLVRDNSLAGIRFEGAGSNNVTGNVVRDNNQTGVYLSGSAASNNTLTDNTIMENGADGIFDGIELISGPSDSVISDNLIWNNTGSGVGVSSSAGSNNLIDGNNASSNRVGIQLQSDDNTVTGNELLGNDVYGVRLASSANTLQDNLASGHARDGFSLVSASNNNLTNNTAINNSRDGFWLQGGSDFNNVTDNVAESNGRSGIYLGGVSGFADNNTLVNNTIRGPSTYGLWIGSAANNTMVENLVENTDEGIELFGDATDNTFTNDTSRNNTWDFLTVDLAADNPVTNLDIGNSTAPNTTLSFEAENVQLRANDTPPADPSDATNIGRYVEAENTTTGAYLDLALSYEQGDADGVVVESSLELLRHNGTAWVAVPGSGVDTGANVVTANVTTFSTFGAFGDAEMIVSNLSALDIAGEGTSAVVADGAVQNVTANVTNTGNAASAFNVTLTIGTQVTVNATTATLNPGETETVVFENVTASLAISTDAYAVNVSTDNDTLAGDLRVHPDVDLDGTPARDTTGDGLLNDVTGDEIFDIFDVQVLFDNLDAPVVQDNFEFFQFAGTGLDRVSIFDIQGLFAQLQAQPAPEATS